MTGPSAIRGCTSLLGLLGAAALFVAARPPSVSTGPGRGAAITFNLASNRSVVPGQVVEFTVTATAPTKSRVRLVATNPPPGCVFTQDAGPPPIPQPGSGVVVNATGRVRWQVALSAGGFRRLTFRAIDLDRSGQDATGSLDVRIVGTQPKPNGNEAVQVGDVTGDGLLDTVAGAVFADLGAALDAGAIYVWNAATAPTGAPDATLVVPGATGMEFLGSLAPYTGFPPPTPVGQGIQLADVTGDGVLDVVAGASSADVAGMPDAGAICVWKGGASLAGTPAPFATLAVPGAASTSNLGYAAGQGVELIDLSNDGVLDVVAGCWLATVGGVAHCGAVYVWKGGPALAGSPAPSCTLAAPNASTDDLLGSASGQGIQFADVSGDGRLDVIVGADYADLPGALDSGAIYVWSGAALGGTPAPLATLTIPAPMAYDHLSRTNLAYAQGIQLADVTGDGVLDVVAGAAFADYAGKVDVGTIYVWAGGPTLVGAAWRQAILAVPNAASYDSLGNLYARDQGIQLADVTGDGVLDVIASANRADVAGVPDAGAVYVWTGGAAMTGTPAPRATLTIPGAAANDMLGVVLPATQSVQLDDLSGDGVLDVIVGASLADAGGVVDAGAIFVWQGGVALKSAPAPLATLTIPGAVAGDQLGHAVRPGIQCADVTGDGVRDLVAGAVFADVAGVTNAGAIFVWSGGAPLAGTPAPLARLGLAAATAFDSLGDFELADLAGDATLDVVAHSSIANVAGKTDVGAILVWNGGAALSGTPAPSATLTVPAAINGDQLGSATGPGVLLGDVTGDGALDVIAGAPLANLGGLNDVGSIHVFRGGATLGGAASPLATLTVAGAIVADKLGSTFSQGLLLADVTGDGVLDVVGVASFANFGATDTGALYQWKGGATLNGSPALLRKLAVPGAKAGDRLGT
jgi:hypothetical protein